MSLLRRIAAPFHIFVFSLFFTLSGISFAEPGYITFPSDVDWVTRHSTHFQIFYRRGQTELGDRALKAAEKAHSLLNPIFPETPEKTYIVIADFKDSLNGYAIDYPFPHMVIFASPPEGGSTLGSLDEWLESVILHEYVHVLHFYPVDGAWRVAKSLFGSWILPNALMPSHLHEGLAVLLETELGDSGRGQGAEYKMYRRMAVKSGKWGDEFYPLDLLEGSPLHWPHGTSAYFFGYWAWSEIWKRKKSEGVRSMVEAQSGNWPYWVSRPMGKVLGTDYPTLWKDIFQNGRQEAQAEIDAIEKENPTPQKFLSETYFSKSDLTLSPDKTLFAFRFTDPELGSKIEIRETQTLNTVTQIDPTGPGDTGMCFGKWRDKMHLVYVESKLDAGYQTHILKAYNIETKDTVTLEGIEHVHAITCKSDLSEMVVYTEQATQGSIKRFKEKKSASLEFEPAEAWAIPNATWVSSLLLDDVLYFILREKTGSFLYQWSFNSPPTNNGHLSEKAFYGLITDDKNHLFSIGGESNRNELWQIQPKTAAVAKKAVVMGGLNSAAFLDGKRMLALSYRHGGYDIAELNPDNNPTFSPPKKTGIRSTSNSKPGPIPMVVERETMSATPTAADFALKSEEEYSPWATLWPRAWFPNLLIVPNGMQVSALVPGFDIGQRHFYTLYGGYDSRGSPFAEVTYAYRFQRKTIFQSDVFFMPSYIISARGFIKTWGATVGLSGVLDFIDPHFGLNLQFKKVEDSPLGPEKQSVGVGVSYAHTLGFKSRPMAVSPHRGTRLSVNYSKFFKEMGSDDNYDTLMLSAEQYMSTPWLGSHIFYFGARAGYTLGTTIYNSFLQGGGELIFSQGKGFFLNRGFYPGTFLGRRMFTLNSEYRFPIANVYRGHGVWPAFLKRIHGALVCDVLTFDYGTRSVNRQDFFKNFFGTLGMEIKTDWKLFYYVPTTLHVGLYRGFGHSDYYGIRPPSFYATFAAEAELF